MEATATAAVTLKAAPSPSCYGGVGGAIGVLPRSPALFLSSCVPLPTQLLLYLSVPAIQIVAFPLRRRRPESSPRGGAAFARQAIRATDIACRIEIVGESQLYPCLHLGGFFFSFAPLLYVFDVAFLFPVSPRRFAGQSRRRRLSEGRKKKGRKNKGSSGVPINANPPSTSFPSLRKRFYCRTSFFLSSHPIRSNYRIAAFGHTNSSYACSFLFSFF